MTAEETPAPEPAPEMPPEMMIATPAERSSYKELEDDYLAWKADPAPRNMHRIVQKLRPLWESNLAGAGDVNSPSMRMKAKVVVADAVRTYDPSQGVNLTTWAGSQLQRLGRIRRETQGPVSIPDRIWLDHTSLNRAERDFIAKHNREPDVKELSDAAGMTVERLQKVRRTVRKMPSQGVVDAAGMALVAEQVDSSVDEAVDYVYADASPMEKQIIEMRTGYGGKYEPMDLAAIAATLGLSIPAVSRKASAIGMRINDVANAHAQVYGR